MEHAGILLSHYAIVPDKIDAIRNEVTKALECAECVVLNGGTGLTHDDCTIEAVAPLLEKKIEGFGELFRLLVFRKSEVLRCSHERLQELQVAKRSSASPDTTGAVTISNKRSYPPRDNAYPHSRKQVKKY